MTFTWSRLTHSQRYDDEFPKNRLPKKNTFRQFFQLQLYTSNKKNVIQPRFLSRLFGLLRIIWPPRSIWATRTLARQNHIGMLLNYSTTLLSRHMMSTDYEIAMKRNQYVLIRAIILMYLALSIAELTCHRIARKEK